MISPFWVVVVAVALLTSSRRPELFIIWIAVFACFPAAAVLSVGSGPAGFGVSPYYATALWAALWCLRRPRATLAFALRRPQIYLLLFVLYAVLGALTLPEVFSGIGVYSPRVGIDAQVNRQTPLSLSPSQFGQVGYLLLNYSVYLFVARRVSPGGRPLSLALGTALVISLWQLISQYTPLPFPRDIVAGNTAYAYLPDQRILGLPRINGSFLEVSMASAFFATMSTYFGGRYVSTGRLSALALALGALAATAVSLSTTGTLVVLMSSVALIGAAIQRALRRGRIRRQDILLILLLAGVGLAAGGASQYLIELTVGKFGTLSFANRGASNAYALRLTAETFGLGVGLGSNRPSSFATALLSTVGLVPTLLLLALILAVLWRGWPRIMVWTLAAYLLAKLISLPDLNDAWLWLLLALCMSGRALCLPQPLPGGSPLALRR